MSTAVAGGGTAAPASSLVLGNRSMVRRDELASACDDDER